MKLNKAAEKANERAIRESNKIPKQKLLQDKRDTAAKAREAKVIEQAQRRTEINAHKAEQQRKKVATQAKNTNKSTSKGKRKALGDISGNTKRRRSNAGGRKAVATNTPAPQPPASLTRRGRSVNLPSRYQ